MKRVGELYEVVVFTASVSKVGVPGAVLLVVGPWLTRNQYGDPLLDQLDIHNVVHHRLFRDSCYNHQGNYVKVCTRGKYLHRTTALITLKGSLPSWP